MFDNYPHVSVTVIAKPKCGWCGSEKNTVERLFNQSPKATEEILATIEAQSQLNSERNKVWEEISDKRIDLFTALYKLEILRRKSEADPFLKRGGTSDAQLHLTGSCVDCGKNVSADINAVAKTLSEMPGEIYFYLKTLPSPPREIIARALEELDGTVESNLAKIDEEQYKKLVEFEEKTRAELLALGIDPYLTDQFNTFLQEHTAWIQQVKGERYARFYTAIEKIAKQMAVSGLPPTLYEKITAKVQDVNDRLHGRTGLLLS